MFICFEFWTAVVIIRIQKYLLYKFYTYYTTKLGKCDMFIDVIVFFLMTFITSPKSWFGFFFGLRMERMRISWIQDVYIFRPTKKCIVKKGGAQEILKCLLVIMSLSRCWKNYRHLLTSKSCWSKTVNFWFEKTVIGSQKPLSSSVFLCFNKPYTCMVT